MTSRAQKNAGYLLPANLSGSGEICVSFRFPNTLEYRAAVRGQLMELGKWWIWEKSYQPGDTRATEAAAIFREYLADFLSFGDCGGFEMPEFRVFGCALQIRFGDDPWETVPGGENICGADGQDGLDGTNGRTPELRSVEIGDCNEHQWKYTDEGNEDWRTLGYVCDGADGKDGVDGAPGGGGGRLGDIIATARGEIPPGCLPCDGSEYDGADYPELYDVLHPSLRLGGDRFKTPDLRGRTIFGPDASIGRIGSGPEPGDTGGTDRTTLTVDEMPPHNHDGYGGDTYSQFAIGGSGAAADSAGPYAGSYDTGYSGGGDSHENMPPYQAWEFYIVAAPASTGALRAIRLGNCARLEQQISGEWVDIETWRLCDAIYPKPDPEPPTTTEQIRCDFAQGLLAWLEDLRFEVHAGLVAGDDRAALATRISDMEWRIVGGGGRAYGYWLFFVDAILPFMTPQLWLSGLSDAELRDFAEIYYCNLVVREDKSIDSAQAEAALFDYLEAFTPDSWVAMLFYQILQNIGVPSFENAALVYDVEGESCDFGCDEQSTPCAVVGKEVEAGGALCEIEDLGGGWIRIHAEYLSGYGFWRVAFATACCLRIDNAALTGHQGTTSASMIAECAADGGAVHSLQPTTTNPTGWLVGKSLAPEPLPGNEGYEYGMWLNGYNDFYLDVHLVTP